MQNGVSSPKIPSCLSSPQSSISKSTATVLRRKNITPDPVLKSRSKQASMKRKNNAGRTAQIDLTPPKHASDIEKTRQKQVKDTPIQRKVQVEEDNSKSQQMGKHIAFDIKPSETNSNEKKASSKYFKRDVQRKKTPFPKSLDTQEESKQKGDENTASFQNSSESKTPTLRLSTSDSSRPKLRQANPNPLYPPFVSDIEEIPLRPSVSFNDDFDLTPSNSETLEEFSRKLALKQTHEPINVEEEEKSSLEKGKIVSFKKDQAEQEVKEVTTHETTPKFKRNVQKKKTPYPHQLRKPTVEDDNDKNLQQKTSPKVSIKQVTTKSIHSPTLRSPKFSPGSATLRSSKLSAKSPTLRSSKFSPVRSSGTPSPDIRSPKTARSPVRSSGTPSPDVRSPRTARSPVRSSGTPSPEIRSPKTACSPDEASGLNQAASNITQTTLQNLIRKKNMYRLGAAMMLLFTPLTDEKEYMPTASSVETWLRNWEMLSVLLKQIAFLIKSNTVTNTAIKRVFSIMSTIASDLCEEEQLVYNFLDQAIEYFQSTPKDRIKADQPLTPRRYRMIDSPVRRYIKSPPMRLSEQYRPPRIEDILVKKNPDLKQIRYAALQNQHELRQMRSAERLDEWNEKREIRRVNTEEELRIQKIDIEEYARERFRHHDVVSEKLKKEKEWKDKLIVDRAETLGVKRDTKITEAKQKANCEVQRGKEAALILRARKAERRQTTYMKDVHLSEYLRTCHLNDADVEKKATQEQMHKALLAMQQEKTLIQSRKNAPLKRLPSILINLDTQSEKSNL